MLTDGRVENGDSCRRVDDWISDVVDNDDGHKKNECPV
jgi:hypothetical protein